MSQVFGPEIKFVTTGAADAAPSGRASTPNNTGGQNGQVPKHRPHQWEIYAKTLGGCARGSIMTAGGAFSIAPNRRIIAHQKDSTRTPKFALSMMDSAMIDAILERAHHGEGPEGGTFGEAFASGNRAQPLVLFAATGFDMARAETPIGHNHLAPTVTPTP